MANDPNPALSYSNDEVREISVCLDGEPIGTIRNYGIGYRFEGLYGVSIEEVQAKLQQLVEGRPEQ